MNRILCMLAALALPALAMSQEPALSIKGDGVKVVKVDRVITIKEDATVVQSFPFSVHAPAGKGLYFWTAPGMAFEDRNDSISITSAPKGPATISVKAVGVRLDKDGRFLDFETKTYSVAVNIGDVPAPTPVPPPVPTPDPVPPPSPAPIPLPGLRVLLTYEDNAADKQKLKIEQPDQYWALFGGDYRDWFKANCTKGADGLPEVRIYDKDAVLAGEQKHWRDAFDRTKGKGVPYMIISNHPRGGWEGPMPKADSEIKALLEKFK
jgi:hypothetical protein